MEAARDASGVASRIPLRHILPDTLVPIIVGVSFAVPSHILAEAGLSFLGIGIQPPTASWGSMVCSSFRSDDVLTDVRHHAAALIACIMMAFAALGDGLRDALDPRMTGGQVATPAD